MEICHRMPLRDLPLGHSPTQGIVTGSKTPRNHKRPLSPSRATPFNPAKCRVLDAECIPSPCVYAVTPTRPSRLGNRLVRNYESSQGTLSPLPLHRCSPPRELYPQPAAESSTDPQSRHYPGFDIFRDSEHPRGFPGPRIPPPSDGDAQIDRSEEDKENVPLRRRAKKPYSKKHLLPGLDCLDASCYDTRVQTSKVIHPARTPFSVRQALR